MFVRTSVCAYKCLCVQVFVRTSVCAYKCLCVQVFVCTMFVYKYMLYKCLCVFVYKSFVVLFIYSQQYISLPLDEEDGLFRCVFVN